MRKRYSHIELLGTIAIPDEQYESSQYRQDKIQGKFKGLRDERETGDWFLPGPELLAFIQEHTRRHFCSRSCSGGSSIEEEMRDADLAASKAMARTLFQKG